MCNQIKKSWMPTVTQKVLKKRAGIMSQIRKFLNKKGILEVETPLLSKVTSTDPNLNSIFTNSCLKNKLYLQTSPEFHMKRLLASGNGDIYQICKAFRDGEAGHQHNPEFTILEWYRVGLDHHALMDEMDEFLQFILKCGKAIRLTYAEIFRKYLKMNPHTDDIKVLQNKIAELHLDQIKNLNYDDRDILLQLLMTHYIEPKLKGVIFIYDYPPSQAMLARIQNDVAERFEVYVNGVELANGFYELTDAKEQRKRFEEDLEKRRQLGLPQIPIDENLLAALAYGLPNCSGVALGIDRLMMLALNKKNIHDVIT